MHEARHEVREETTEVALDPATVETLRASLRGELILPSDTGYENARQVWNGMIDRRPALIVRCSGAADVIRAVGFAREQGLPVAVRGGGHNVAGNATCDGGIVIDLGLMRGVRVDPRRRTMWAEAGCRWGDVDDEAWMHGLAMPGGAVSTTGIAGLTLGGGVGWLSRRFGLTCDQVRSVDLVTADGRLVTASAEEHPDLFWGVRGGGGNFGIVTSFEYQLHPVERVTAGLVLYPLDQARAVARFYREFAAAAPEELTTLLLFTVATPTPTLPPELYGVPMIGMMFCYSGPQQHEEAALALVRRFGTPLFSQIEPTPYPRLQKMIDAGSPPGLRNYWKAGFLKGLDDDAVETIVEHCRRGATPSLPGIMLEIFQFDGATNRVALDATAFAHRGATFDFTAVAKWRDPAQDERYIAWAHDFYAAMRPHLSGGVYVNYLGGEGAERVRAAYGANYEQLVALKNTYDPTNFFRLNQNIRPTL
jgi:FAD/FMN-containing dehydrogenase